LLFARFGHIPAEGEEVRVGDWNLRVVEMDKRRVAQVVATFVGDAEPGVRPVNDGNTDGQGAADSVNGSGETAG
jgi:Mg2+/Co2+ transporter CorC